MTRPQYNKLNYALSNGRVLITEMIAQRQMDGLDAGVYADFLARAIEAREVLHELSLQMTLDEWCEIESPKKPAQPESSLHPVFADIIATYGGQ